VHFGTASLTVKLFCHQSALTEYLLHQIFTQGR